MDPQEAKIYLAILIIAGILATILIFFLVTLTQQQKRSIKLHKEKIAAEITTLENERKRVSADLHDGLGPILSTVKFQIRSVEPRDEEDLAMIQSASKHIDDMLGRIREIANNLNPAVLVRAGLIRAIEEFAEGINISGQAKVTCYMDPEAVPHKKEMEIHIYRIVLEIIHNAIKHTSGAAIEVILEPANNKKIFLKISDSGKGFNIEEVMKRSNGLGLRSIMSRVDMIGGDMYIDSSSAKGTTYSIEIPYN